MIRWIIPGRLGTGPAQTADAPGAVRIDVRRLVDGPGNAPAVVAELIERGSRALEAGSPVLVVCDFGVSRSNAVAAGILARFRAVSVSDAVREVVARTGESEIKLPMIETVRAAVGEARGPETTGAIAVTGATGTVGRAVAERLGPQAVALGGRADFDLQQAPALLAARLGGAGVGTILHLAHPRVFSNNSALGAALHQQKNVMDVAATLGATFVLVSCSAVFGRSASGARMPTDAPRRPGDVVGLIKSLQETLAEAAEQSGGPRSRIIRVAPVYGRESPRPRFLRSFLEAIMAGEPVATHRFDDGPAAMELLHLSDAAAGIVAAVTRGAAPVCHLGGVETVETRRIAEILARLVGKPLIHEEIRLEGACGHARLDWTATQAELGWSPVMTLEAGLAEVVEGIARHPA
ncbi:MAG: NAD-dependent epimerase/dehydratase family protein [Alphaproteobacteria bacterium]|nr:NAD-dependent epimerase/dehydratase family protein [Alphaproteobacteria bacterium]MDX5370510.1 NAD-dependent epimerase/dehydratase family protein [Alphaproteobacteria bacterium]